MQLRSQIVVMPPIHRMRRALRAIKRARTSDIALVLPEKATSFASVPGLAQVLTWADQHRKDLTLVGGNSNIRAEALVYGMRVATDTHAWAEWLDEALLYNLHQANQFARAANGGHGWRVIHTKRQDHDLQPSFVLEIGRQAGMVLEVPDFLRYDECYEDAVVATLWDTSNYSNDLADLA